MVRYSDVASLFIGGASGAIHEVTDSFHLPAIFAICWCSGPGAAAFMYLSIIACSSGLIFLASLFASSARAANEISTNAAAIFMWVVPFARAAYTSLTVRPAGATNRGSSEEAFPVATYDLAIIGSGPGGYVC